MYNFLGANGQQGQYQQPQQQQPQQTGFPGQQQMMPQPTGYMQFQQTGFPSQQAQQQQQFQNQQQQQQQQPTQQQFTGFPNTLQGFPSQQGIPPVPQLPNMTTFSPPPQQQQQPPPPPQQSATPTPKNLAKIPNIRLSFITVADQAKFEQLFKAAVGDGQALPGETARDILLRSKLLAQDLHQIWQLADTTKSGQLLFPEFALAMYLCNMKRNGRTLPATLPEVVKNEVSGMVDIISFGIPDSAPVAPPRTNVPSFEVSAPSQQPPPQNTISPAGFGGQNQPNNSQLLGMNMSAQPAGFQSQQTGFQQPQQTGFQSQPTGFQRQPTGFQGGLQSQQTGFQGLQSQQTGFPGLQSQQTGYQAPSTLSSQATGYQSSIGSYSGSIPPVPPIPTGIMSSLSIGGPGPLQTQPTGHPGQWGFVNAPANILGGIEALQQRMMPQKGREGGFSMQGLQGNAVIPWSITKVEKEKYDIVFEGWDGFHRGFITGDTAIEVFGQSGLPKDGLMAIWTLADTGNKGKLNKDEFAVAMHLIFRKLNGYDIPARLPPELIPPSTKKFSESLNTVKSYLQKGQTANALQSQATGVSYLKSRSFHSDTSSAGKKDGTVYRFDDNEVGYKSNARHRARDGRSPSPMPGSASPAPEEMSLGQLRKKIREKQILLGAVDTKDEAEAEDDEILDRRDRRDADDLYRRIRRVQEDIDAHPNSGLAGGDTEVERRQLRRQLQNLTDRLPDLASKVRKTERNIADAKLELFKLRDAKAHPRSAASIVGTGPGGSVTESDRIKAKSRAMMQQRLAALTGKPIASDDDDEAGSRRLAEETQKVNSEKERNERMTRDVEESLDDFRKGLEDSLRDTPGESGSSTITDHERRRWDEALGVEDEVKEFIFDLQRQTRAAKARYEDDRRYDDRPRTKAFEEPARSFSSPPLPLPLPHSSTPASSTASYSSFKSAEDRATFIKQQAERKMAERLAALGLQPPSRAAIGETTQQRMERERKEKEERLRQAEEEESQREQQRRQRLADEQVKPPSPIVSKKPPPPAPRKVNNSRIEDERKKAEEDAKAEQEEVLRREQEAQEAKRMELEEETRQEEEELMRAQEAAKARLQALEQGVKQGKLRKEEEKQKKKAALQASKEKEAKLAAMRAEIEKAKEEEKRLWRLQMELDEDSSSDDEEPETVGKKTPTQESTGEELVLAPPTQPTPPPPPPAASLPPSTQASSPSSGTPATSTDKPNNNPFFNKTFGPVPTDGTTSVISPPPAPATAPSKNPFYNFGNDATATTASPAIQSPPRTYHHRPLDEDDWSVVDDANSDSDDDDPLNRQSTKELAEKFFANMVPPRPLSSMGNEESSPSLAPGGAPPPPPPPPPPPMPGMGMGMATNPVSLPAAPPPEVTGDRGSLLSQITMGKQLKKTQTKDRSAPPSGGRVLG